jgi:6-phospho-beta-glucosidase
MKLCVIGGGSTYTPELLEGLIQRHADFGLEEVVLMDIAPERLEPVGGFCARMVKAAGSPFTLRWTTDRVDAVRGASFVVNQIRVGGNEARHEDIQLGLRHGLIGQETTGVGGFAKALRTIPQVLDIARTVEAHAPEAWVVNFANPSGIITEALIRHASVKTVGLCNIPIDMRMELAKHLKLEVEKVAIDYTGLNHLGWVRRVRVDGEDISDTIWEAMEDMNGPANIPEITYPKGFLRALKGIPSPYLRYFYATDEMYRGIKDKPKSRAQEVLELEKQLFALYADETLDTKPALLNERGGAWYSRVAVDVMAALTRNEAWIDVVNVQNRGTIPELPFDAVIETNAVLRKGAIDPLPVPALEPDKLALLVPVKAYEQLTISAATRGSYQDALLALVAHPLVPTADLAAAVLDDIIASGGFTPEG